ncbi:hypothetical protein BAE44_0011709, partial [Dichanthelium oligosanthes]
LEDAGDQARSSRRGGRKASRRTRLGDGRKKLLEEALKNPPIRRKEEEEEEEEEEDRGIVDEEEADQDAMRLFRRGWEQCFGRSCGSFQDNSTFSPFLLLGWVNSICQ